MGAQNFLSRATVCGILHVAWTTPGSKQAHFSTTTSTSTTTCPPAAASAAVPCHHHHHRTPGALSPPSPSHTWALAAAASCADCSSSLVRPESATLAAAGCTPRAKQVRPLPLLPLELARFCRCSPPPTGDSGPAAAGEGSCGDRQRCSIAACAVAPPDAAAWSAGAQAPPDWSSGGGRCTTARLRRWLRSGRLEAASAVAAGRLGCGPTGRGGVADRALTLGCEELGLPPPRSVPNLAQA
jgi:hypothetical protein